MGNWKFMNNVCNQVILSLWINYTSKSSLKGAHRLENWYSPAIYTCMYKYLLLFFLFLLDQGPFLGATDYPFFGLRVTLSMGFKARVVLSPAHLLACMWWTQGSCLVLTPAFSTNRGVHCISKYTAGPPSGHPSCKQWRAGNSGH